MVMNIGEFFRRFATKSYWSIMSMRCVIFVVLHMYTEQMRSQSSPKNSALASRTTRVSADWQTLPLAWLSSYVYAVPI